MDKETIAIFLDIAAAIDTICPGLIREKLLEHGGDLIMVNWYYKFITHRNLQVEINVISTCNKNGLHWLPTRGGGSM